MNPNKDIATYGVEGRLITPNISFPDQHLKCLPYPGVLPCFFLFEHQDSQYIVRLDGLVEMSNESPTGSKVDGRIFTPIIAALRFYDVVVFFEYSGFKNIGGIYNSFHSYMGIDLFQLASLSMPCKLVNDNIYIKLYHHTSSEGYDGITKSEILRGSKWNLSGTRELDIHHCYLTCAPNMGDITAGNAILINRDRGIGHYLQADDGINRYEFLPWTTGKDLSKRITIYTPLSIVKPNPMIHHFGGYEWSHWIEIMFGGIFRCPCESLPLKKRSPDHMDYIVDIEKTRNIRLADPIYIFWGNHLMSLKHMVDEDFD